MKITMEEKQTETDADYVSRFIRNTKSALSAKKLPETTTNTVAEVSQHIEQLVLTAIKDEVQTDPVNRGYAGKTNAEIADLMNAAYTVDVIVDTKTIKDPRMPRSQVVLFPFPYAPNAVTETDIAEAMV